MGIRFVCSQCGQEHIVSSKQAGKKGKCPCGVVIVVPAPAKRADSTEKISFRCENCGQGIKVPQAHAGKKGRCPKCKGPVVVPGGGIGSRHAGGAEAAIAAEISAVVGVAGGAGATTPVEVSRPGIVVVQCPICQTSIRARESSRGNLVECSNCGSFAEVPEADEMGGDGVSLVIGKGGAVVGVKEAPKPAPCTGKVVCPSCEEKLADDAAICVGCGIYVNSGRPIVMARGADEDELHERAERIVRGISWLIPSGMYPFYSEAIGRHRPYATWAITALTVLISGWFLAYEISGSPKFRSMKNLMLWAGDVEPSAERIEMFYEWTNYGDSQAFDDKRNELAATTAEDKLNQAAHKALSPEEQCFGQYRTSQLVTHAFLHGGILHLAGNMLFLLVFGSRVNSAIGNILTVVLYIVLGIGAGLAHIAMSGPQEPTPMLGASGAVMGMAGVYLLLFPIHKIYMTGWIRWGLLAGFHLSFKVWAWRGLWVVLFYIMFDVIAVCLVMESGTAHWAHIGGLVLGAVCAFILLVSRAVYSGSDVVSLILGKYAWGLMGSPSSRRRLSA